MVHGIVVREAVKNAGANRVTVRDYRSTLSMREVKSQKVGITDYYFRGYTTSIVECLLGMGEKFFFVDPDHKSREPSATLMIEIVGLMKGASDQLVSRVQGAFGGLAGNAVVGGQIIGHMMDAQTIAARTGITGRLETAAKNSKPNALSKIMDKQLNGRIEVKVGSHFNTRAGRAAQVIDLGANVDRLSCAQLAAFVVGRKPPLSDPMQAEFDAYEPSL